MARIRTLKPEMMKDAKIAELSDAAFRLFISAIMSADDFGNLEADERLLKSAIWWAHDEPPRVAAVLGELRRAALIRQYTVRGQQFLHLCGWSKHQRIDNAGKPLVPKPNDPNAIEFIDEAVMESLALGDSPRTSANLGDSPLDHDPDHDLDPEHSDSHESPRAGSPTVEHICNEPKKRKRTPAHALPDDWEPNESQVLRARQSSLDVNREAERFRNHAAQNDRKCVNWTAAFNNWLLSSEERRGPARSAPQRRAGLDTQDILDLANDLEKRGM